jgi:hypothetical protein
MFEDTYSQLDALDPVLDAELVLSLVRRRVPDARTVTGIDESGGEARTYGQVAEIALAALPANEERVALHSNPGPEHTFVFPESGMYSGLIDSGDAFISHPALDLRRRAGPRYREAIMRGYTTDAPVGDTFKATWRVVKALSDLIDIAYYPDRAAPALEDLQDVLHRLAR